MVWRRCRFVYATLFCFANVLFRLRETPTFEEPDEPSRAGPGQAPACPAPCHVKWASRLREMLISKKCPKTHCIINISQIRTRAQISQPRKSRASSTRNALFFLRLEFGAAVVWRRCRFVYTKRHLFCKHAVSSTRNAYFRRAKRAEPSRAGPSPGVPYHVKWASRLREVNTFWLICTCHMHALEFKPASHCPQWEP